MNDTFIGELPIAPPDPIGNILWHEVNGDDLIVKGDGILKKVREGEEEPQSPEPESEEDESGEVAISGTGRHAPSEKMMTPMEKIIASL